MTAGGWRIGNGMDYDDPDYQDEVESQALFNVLENDVIPVFMTGNGEIHPKNGFR